MLATRPSEKASRGRPRGGESAEGSQGIRACRRQKRGGDTTSASGLFCPLLRRPLATSRSRLPRGPGAVAPLAHSRKEGAATHATNSAPLSGARPLTGPAAAAAATVATRTSGLVNAVTSPTHMGWRRMGSRGRASAGAGPGPKGFRLPSPLPTARRTSAGSRLGEAEPRGGPEETGAGSFNYALLTRPLAGPELLRSPSARHAGAIWDNWQLSSFAKRDC